MAAAEFRLRWRPNIFLCHQQPRSLGSIYNETIHLTCIHRRSVIRQFVPMYGRGGVFCPRTILIWSRAVFSILDVAALSHLLGLSCEKPAILGFVFPPKQKPFPVGNVTTWLATGSVVNPRHCQPMKVHLGNQIISTSKHSSQAKIRHWR